MIPHAKVSRLIEIEQFLLCGFDNLPVERQSPILHEALGLSEELELDRNWRYYKGRLEALQQTELQRKKAEIAEKGGILSHKKTTLRVFDFCSCGARRCNCGRC